MVYRIQFTKSQRKHIRLYTETLPGKELTTGEWSENLIPLMNLEISQHFTQSQHISTTLHVVHDIDDTGQENVMPPTDLDEKNPDNALQG